MTKARVLIADDHAIVLEGLTHILAAYFEVAGTAADGRQLIAAAAELRPDVIVADVSMPNLNGIEAVREIKKVQPEVRVVFLTMHPDASYAKRALQAGGEGYVLKHTVGAELCQAIESVLRGEMYVSPILLQRYPDLLQSAAAAEDKGAELTARQREIVQLIAEGRTSREIAEMLGISLKTVEFHRQNIMERLGLRTTADVTRYAIRHGITSSIT